MLFLPAIRPSIHLSIHPSVRPSFHSPVLSQLGVNMARWVTAFVTGLVDYHSRRGQKGRRGGARWSCGGSVFFLCMSLYGSVQHVDSQTRVCVFIFISKCLCGGEPLAWCIGTPHSSDNEPDTSLLLFISCCCISLSISGTLWGEICLALVKREIN